MNTFIFTITTCLKLSNYTKSIYDVKLHQRGAFKQFHVLWKIYFLLPKYPSLLVIIYILLIAFLQHIS